MIRCSFPGPPSPWKRQNCSSNFLPSAPNRSQCWRRLCHSLSHTCYRLRFLPPLRCCTDPTLQQPYHRLRFVPNPWFLETSFDAGCTQYCRFSKPSSFPSCHWHWSLAQWRRMRRSSGYTLDRHFGCRNRLRLCRHVRKSQWTGYSRSWRARSR
jgi:hypothetical protein